MTKLQKILSHFSPAQFIEDCEKDREVSAATLLQMCVMQQLAAGLKSGQSDWDFSRAMEWLQNLLLKFLQNESSVYEVCGGKAAVKTVLGEMLADLKSMNSSSGEIGMNMLLMLLSSNL